MPRDRLQIGEWEVDPSTFCLTRQDERRPIEPKSMAVLVLLASHAGEVVPKEEVISCVWADTFVTDGVLWQCIRNLRRVFQDDPKHPRYIETIPRSGYRLLAPVRILEASGTDMRPTARPSLGRRSLPHSLRSIGLPVAAAVFLLLMLAMVTEWWLPSGAPDRGDPGKIKRRSWLLIADFENATGEEMLDGTLEVALETELSAFDSLGVVDRSRINDSLRLMRKPLNSKIGLKLGEEICLRDGHIDEMITGEVDRRSDGYALHLRLWDPMRQQVVGQITRSGLAWNQILPVIHRLAGWVSQSLPGGDHGLGGSFEAVTTSSLEALNYYSRAVRAYRNHTDKNHYAAAEGLLREAIEADPEFASAYLLLAWAVFAQHPEQPEAGHLFEKAVEYSHNTSPPERFFILGCYHHFLGGLRQPKAGWREQYEKAAVAYRAVLELQPNHQWAAANLQWIERSNPLSRTSIDKVTDRLLLTARLRPNSLPIQQNAASWLLGEFHGRAAASPYILRGLELLGDYPDPAAAGVQGVWLRVFPSYERWLDGDVEGALKEADRVRKWITTATLPTSLRDRHSVYLGYVYLALGRLDTVAGILRSLEREPLESEPENNLYLFRLLRVQYAYLTGNARVIKREPVAEMHSFSAFRAVLPMIVLRVDPEIGERITSSLFGDLPDGQRDLIEGDRALLEGNLPQAISQLSRGLKAVKETWIWIPSAELLRGSISLAEAYILQGRPRDAIAVLERTADLKEGTFPLGGALWLEAQRLLADVYLWAGEVSKARQLDDVIHRYLRVATPDFPLRKPGYLLTRIRRNRPS